MATALQATGGMECDRARYDRTKVRFNDPIWDRVENASVYRCRVVLVEESDGFSAFAADLPGTISQGDSIEEAVENITEALQGSLAEYISAGRIPWKPVAVEGEGQVERWITVHV